MFATRAFAVADTTFEGERQSLAAARLGALLPVAAGVIGLDASFNVLSRPDLFSGPMVPRALLVAGLAGLYAGMRWWAPLRSRPVLVALLGAGALLVYVGWLIRITDGANSPLQPGILLVMLGTQLLVPLRGNEALALALVASLGWAEGIVGQEAEPWRIAAGAFYLLSGVVVTVLTATVNTRLRREAWEARQRLDAEHALTERVLYSALPSGVVARLKRGEAVADTWPDAVVLFADIVGFTALSSDRAPLDVLALLSRTFARFDALVARHGVEKIKTVGDAYMVAAGLGEGKGVDAMADLALEMLAEMDELREPGGARLTLRIGIHAGPVVAGVLGNERFLYDLWGDTVNVAARMEAMGLPGRVQVTDAVRERLPVRLRAVERGVLDVKGKGPLRTWLLEPRA